MVNRRRLAILLLPGISLPGILVTQAIQKSRIGQAEAQVLERVETAAGGHLELLSPIYDLNRQFQSMQGPNSNQPSIKITESNPSDLLWITGVEADIVDPDSLTKISPEYFCHANLTLNPDVSSPEIHNEGFGGKTHLDWRLFTLIPGRLSLRLPEGFGIPVKAGTPLDYYTMSLNQNQGRERKIRMRSRVEYRKQSESSPLRPLFRRSVYIYQQHVPDKTEEKLYEVVQGHQGEACAISREGDEKGETVSLFVPMSPEPGKAVHPGATCCVANASPGGVLSQFGNENTIHWMVPPGRHRYRTEVTKQMQLPFDTTVHYATGHLHPFGASLVLKEMETGIEVFRITSEDFDDKLGVQHMSEIISDSGIEIRKDARYKLIADYVNTSPKPIDAMAILYLYPLEKEFSP